MTAKCPECEGVRFNPCKACGGEVNSYHSHDDLDRPTFVGEKDARQPWEKGLRDGNVLPRNP